MPCRIGPQVWPSGYLSNVILASKGIGHTHFALRIVLPLAIDKEAVAMCARLQVNCRVPDTFVPFVQVDGPLFPMRKISYQLYSQCGGRFNAERLMFPIVSFFHNICLSLSKAREAAQLLLR
jgi:hypothetical protein